MTGTRKPGAVTVIHTNDTHGQMRPPASHRLADVLRDHAGALYLDAGDAVTAGNLGFRLGGEPVLTTLGELGCAAMCLGNRETHPRGEIFPRKLDRATFPILCANIHARAGAQVPVSPHVVLTHGELTVGVLGVTVCMFRRREWSQFLTDYWFSDPIEAAREQVGELRSRVDLLIALTHIGFRRDQELAAACPGLDAVIGGHSHTDLDQPHWVGTVPVLQAGSHAFRAGIARFAAADGRWRLETWSTIPLRPPAPRRTAAQAAERSAT